MTQRRIFHAAATQRRPAAEPDAATLGVSARVDYRRQASALRALPAPPSDVERAPVQREEVETNGGYFETETYETFKEKTTLGADMVLKFTPDHQYRQILSKVGMVQSNRRMVTKSDTVAEPSVDEAERARMSDQNWIIDRTQGDEIQNTNPVYQSEENAPPGNARPLRIATTLMDTGDEPHYRGNTWKSTSPNEPATLRDEPRFNNPYYVPTLMKVTDEFETTALDLDTKEYLGSVRWGWSAEKVFDEDDDDPDIVHKVTPAEIEKVSDGDPSPAFLGAARKWNEQQFPAYEPHGDEEQKAIAVAPVQLPIPEPEGGQGAEGAQAEQAPAETDLD